MRLRLEVQVNDEERVTAVDHHALGELLAARSLKPGDCLVLRVVEVQAEVVTVSPAPPAAFDELLHRPTRSHWHGAR